MKQIIAGILAHVDAGKTTLSEALLYSSGSIKKIGRVDNGDAFLDTDAMEKKRGITIFSKQAELQFGDTKMTLLDTPGHVDFSAEMERTLMVLDYAVLVISALPVPPSDTPPEPSHSAPGYSKHPPHDTDVCRADHSHCNNSHSLSTALCLKKTAPAAKKYPALFSVD
jgi:hypothetical protein